MMRLRTMSAWQASALALGALIAACALSLLAGAVWVHPRDLPGSDILTVRVSRILLAIVAGALIARSMSKDAIAWEPYDAQKVVEARENGMPVIMDFSADWCIPCKELELNTFTDPEVIKATRDMVRLKVDLTQFDSPESEALRRVDLNSSTLREHRPKSVAKPRDIF